MLKTWDQITQRVFTSLVAIPVVVAAICWSIWSYYFLFLFVTIATMLEFYGLAEVGGICPNRLWGILSGILVYTLFFAHAAGYLPPCCLYVLFPVIALVYPMELYKPTQAPFSNIAYTLLGITYVSVPFALLHVIAFAQGTYRPEIVWGILLILWANDIGAYGVGSWLGKHRLFRRISPQKSWEGSLGGAVLALVVSYMLACCFGSLGRAVWLAIGIIVVVAGTYGDLVESVFKRSLKLKDSGNIIPGHGGFLDRFDSFLLAIPFVLALIKLLF